MPARRRTRKIPKSIHVVAVDGVPVPPAQKKRRKRVGKDKTGTDFETVLEAVFQGYKNQGIAYVEKVDPPVGVGAKGRVFLKKNPWLDYSGTWTEIGGRHLILEAKSTEDPTLELGEGGITPRQIEALGKWHRAGAACAVIWHHRGTVKVITATSLLAVVEAGGKSIKWQHLPPTPHGQGWIIWDVLAILATTK